MTAIPLPQLAYNRGYGIVCFSHFPDFLMALKVLRFLSWDGLNDSDVCIISSLKSGQSLLQNLVYRGTWSLQFLLNVSQLSASFCLEP